MCGAGSFANFVCGAGRFFKTFCLELVVLQTLCGAGKFFETLRVELAGFANFAWSWQVF